MTLEDRVRALEHVVEKLGQVLIDQAEEIKRLRLDVEKGPGERPITGRACGPPRYPYLLWS